VFHSEVKRYTNSWVARGTEYPLLLSCNRAQHVILVCTQPVILHLRAESASLVQHNVFNHRITTVTAASANIFVDIKNFSIFPHSVYVRVRVCMLLYDSQNSG
jgi:hypothetical protein